MKLKRSFFNRPTLIVARELLGKYLVRKIGRKTITGIITETEAYCGIKDLACHASKGMTERTKIMFGPPGRAYVYMIYGMHHCLNFVTRERGKAEAVLVRGVQIAKSKTQITKLITGPGRVCRAFKIDRKLNGEDLCGNRKIWVENRGEKIKPGAIKRDKRIGIDYSGKWKDKLWRFTISS